MLEVYAIAGGDWLRGNLNAIAAFMGTGTWSTIEKMCIAISVLIVAGNWVKKHNVMELIGWVFSLTLVSMLIVIRTPVQIIDYSNVAQVYEVDNVPIGLAIPASLTTRVGGFAPIFPDTFYHLTHYWPAAADIPVASDNPAHYADAIRYNARTPLQGSLLPLTRLVWA